jgi:protoheme IX farnesyltransferase
VPAWRDYLTLTKPEISFLVTLSAFAGFLLGSQDGIDGWRLLITLVGVVLTSGGVGVLNHYLEHELDGQMRRTACRPLPAGRVSPGAARIFGVLLVSAGVGLLCPLTNPLTGVLAALAVVLYLFVYTPLKRKTKYNTMIGTVPGALPALGGWTAATGNLEAGGWSIFLILAFWQMPHFLALAWMYRKDYGRARYAMLPVVEPDGRSTAFQTLLFTVLLVLVSLLPTLIGLTGWIYLTGALFAGGWFLLPAISFYRTRSVQDARSVLMGSVRYVPLLTVFIVIDHFV